jgi:hypothetical protein
MALLKACTVKAKILVSLMLQMIALITTVKTNGFACGLQELRFSLSVEQNHHSIQKRKGIC